MADVVLSMATTRVPAPNVAAKLDTVELIQAIAVGLVLTSFTTFRAMLLLTALKILAAI